MKIELINDELLNELHKQALNPKAGAYGVQIPKGAWHTVEVFEESCILEPTKSREQNFLPSLP